MVIFSLLFLFDGLNQSLLIITTTIKYVPFCIKTYLLKKIPPLIPPLSRGEADLLRRALARREAGGSNSTQCNKKNTTCLIAEIIIYRLLSFSSFLF